MQTTTTTKGDDLLFMATVPTGLEQVAEYELLSKCTAAKIFTALPKQHNAKQQGRLFFQVPSDHNLSFINDMWSFEKLYAVVSFAQFDGISHMHKQTVNASEEECQNDLKRIEQQVFNESNKPAFELALSCYTRLNHSDAKTFRITPKKAGIHRFSSMNLAVMGAAGFYSLFPQFDPDLTNYDIDLLLYMFFDLCIVAITLCEGLSLKRFHSTAERKLTAVSLRPSIAYAMLHMAQIQPCDLVVDFCCGSGMINSVAKQTQTNNLFYIAGDYSQTTLEIAQLNNPSNTDFLHWSFTELPLRSGVVDVVVANLPFGKKIGSHGLNKKIYPRMMKELARILRDETGRAVLLTTEKLLMHYGIRDNKKYLKLMSRTQINMGGLDVFIYVVQKKSEKTQKKIRQWVKREEFQQQLIEKQNQLTTANNI